MYRLYKRPTTYLQDEESEEWCEVQLAKQWGQDATVDLKVRLSDLRAEWSRTGQRKERLAASHTYLDKDLHSTQQLLQTEVHGSRDNTAATVAVYEGSSALVQVTPAVSQ